MELALFDWCSISEIHLIKKTYNILDGSRMSSDAFHWSIGANGTIGTNAIAVIWLVIHWWRASHYKDRISSINDRGRRVNYEK